MKTYAILTGDLISSQSLSSAERVETLEAMKTFWKQFADARPGAVSGELEVFRGDGWQAALSGPAHGLDAAVFLRAVVKACPQSHKSDTRVGIGIGPADSFLENNLGESQGEAFVASGRALESLSPAKSRWTLLPDNGPLRPLSRQVFPLLDLAVTRWSAAESLAVIGEMLGWTREQTAAHPWAQKKDGDMPTPQAISDALNRVSWKSHLLSVLNEVTHDLSILKTSPEA